MELQNLINMTLNNINIDVYIQGSTVFYRFEPRQGKLNAHLMLVMILLEFVL